jgi:ketosteroid isomerase-like protein
LREVHALFANDEYGMVLVTVRAERQGRRFEDRQVHVYRFRGGRIAEFWLFPGDRQANEEFWAL